MDILPLGKRYGTKEVLDIYSEENKIKIMLEIEGHVSMAQSKINIIPSSAGKNIFEASMSGKINVNRIKELESISNHDIAALVEALGEIVEEDARPYIHYGLTSNDLVDTSTSIQMKSSLDVIERKITVLVKVLSIKASKYEKLPAVGRTHGQHASIISFGLKFANWMVEMSKHLERISESRKRILLCKTLGVVGTGSLMGEDAIKVQKMVSEKLDLYSIEAATQVIPRERYAEYMFIISLLSSTLEKIATEIRNLQRTEIGEVAEKFNEGQIGSSAVPVKRNPIKCERICSLSRLVKSNLMVSLENVPLWHERDLSNSANERFTIPTASILVDDMLTSMISVIENLHVDKVKIKNNLYLTKGQIFAEFVLENMVKKGIPRFTAYRDIQRVAFDANKKNVMYAYALKNDPVVSSILTNDEIDDIFIPENHLGASSLIIKNVNDIRELYI